VGKTSTHPEKVQTNTSKYLHPLACSISIKPKSGFQKEFLQHFAPGVVLLSLVGDCFWHTNCTSHILSYLYRKFGDIKCWAKVVSRAVCPE
jgi:hypothetical protein